MKIFKSILKAVIVIAMIVAFANVETNLTVSVQAALAGFIILIGYIVEFHEIPEWR